MPAELFSEITPRGFTSIQERVSSWGGSRGYVKFWVWDADPGRSGNPMLPGVLLETPLSPSPSSGAVNSAAPRGLSIRSPRRRALQPFLLRVCASPAHFPAAELFGNCFCSFPGMVVALHQGIFVLAICSLSPGRGRIVCCRDGRGGADRRAGSAEKRVWRGNTAAPGL